MKTFLVTTFLSFALACSDSAMADIFKMNVTDFDAVSLKIPADVEWIDSNSPSCILECTADQEKKIEIAMDGNTLVIKSKGNNWGEWNSDKIKVKISSSHLKKVGINGSGDFVMKSPNDSPDFEYSINGSGGLKAMVGSKSCKGTINGSGDVTINGKSDAFELTIHGSGDVKAVGFECVKVDVNIAGSGDAQVFATESLHIKIAGSGDVQYKGEPKNLTQKIAGSGELRKI